jgi:hypothetical protein
MLKRTRCRSQQHLQGVFLFRKSPTEVLSDVASFAEACCCADDGAGFKTEATELVALGTGRVFARGLDTERLEVQSSG